MLRLLSPDVPWELLFKSVYHIDIDMSDFKAKMHKIQFRWGSAPDPAGGAYSTPPHTVAGFNGAYF